MTFAYQNSAGPTSSSGGTGISSASSTAQSVTAGELLVVFFKWRPDTTTDYTQITTTLSGGGLTWNLVAHERTVSNENIQSVAFWAVATTTESITVTLTTDGGALIDSAVWNFYRFSFSGTVSLADYSTSANGMNSAAWNAGISTVGENDLVVILVGHYTSGSDPALFSGFSQGPLMSTNSSQYRIYTTAGGDTEFTAGWSGSNESYCCIALVFHETAGGGGGSAGRVGNTRVKNSLMSGRVR